MPRNASVFALRALAGAALLASAACAPIVGANGFQVIDAAPADVVAGTDTKATVLARLGSPSTTSTFEKDQVWYYISQITEKYTFRRPEVTQRSVTEITFTEGSDQVAEVRTLTLADGRAVSMDGRETPTRGRRLTVLEQLLGNVGRGQLPRNEDEVPGQRRPD